MINALSSGLAGMRAMQGAVDGHAARIAATTLPIAAGATPAVGLADLGGDLLGMRESVLLYKANAETVQAADEALGSLLSLTA